jgi:hypothetical protein
VSRLSCVLFLPNAEKCLYWWGCGLCSKPGLSRETFAVFMEPCWDERMDIPAQRAAAEAQTQHAAKSLPKGVPPISSRWQEGIDFGEFTSRTLKAYH